MPPLDESGGSCERLRDSCGATGAGEVAGADAEGRQVLRARCGETRLCGSVELP